MPLALVIGTDALQVARAEDALRQVGCDPAKSSRLEDVSPRVAQRADLLVLIDSASPDSSALVWRALRSSTQLASLPLLLVCPAGKLAPRVAGLRLGSDDYVTELFQPDELGLRALRLIERRAELGADLAGDLAEFGLSDLLQHLATGTRTGTLRLHDDGHRGQIEIRRGQVLAGRYGVLRGQEALLAMIDRFRAGRFDFHSNPSSPASDTSERTLSVSSVLIYSAWIEDELSRRQHLLPDEDEPLFLQQKLAGPESSDLEAIPIREVQSWLEIFPGATLGELLKRNFAAAKRVRLAIAWLMEKEALSHHPPSLTPVAPGPAPEAVFAE